MNWQAGSRLRLPEATAEIIASIGEHRIVSTAQARAIHYPDRGLRRTQQALAYLEQAGLIAHVERRGSPRRVWFLTEAGADAVILAGEVKERPKVLTPKQAAGPLTAHTLDVNDVGVCFMEMAAEARRGIRAARLAARGRPFAQPRARAGWPEADRRFGLHLRAP